MHCSIYSYNRGSELISHDDFIEAQGEDIRAMVTLTHYREGGQVRGELGFDYFKTRCPIHVRMRISSMFGRTDLRIGASEAKFDARLDFDVHLPPAPQKPLKNDETLISKNRKNLF